MLLDRLMDYGDSNFYPFHMPGHKRQKNISLLKDFPNPYQIDITEIEGFDNLHYPTGILKESMVQAAEIYGADKSYYLINGSSCGVLSAVCATANLGGKIIMSRNCHKSAYYGALLKQLETVYVFPQIIDFLGINGGILANDVEKLLEENPNTQAVLVVSPTYEGIVSDIESIAQAVHRRNIPLIVDEAHGSHFAFSEIFPKSALDCGADIVIQSLHKTLPSFTQTAILHVKRKYVDEEKLERYLQIFQSSSPSYVMMAGIEKCIDEMNNFGHEYLKKFFYRLDHLREHLKGLENLWLLDTSIVGKWGVYDIDLSKIVVFGRSTLLSGVELSEILRKKYFLEMEMCGINYIIAITTFLDTEEGLHRLETALIKIDKKLTKQRKAEVKEKNCLENISDSFTNYKPIIKKKLADAMDTSYIQLPINDCTGRVSSEFIYIYPPGIPIVTPGEQMTKEIIEQILLYKKRKFSIEGMADKEAQYLRVCQEE